MIRNLLGLAILLGACYWYWQGPYQERVNPSQEAQLERNDKNMALCTRANAYQRGATGAGLSDELAEKQCAEKYDLFFEDEHWHSYGSVRRND